MGPCLRRDILPEWSGSGRAAPHPAGVIAGSRLSICESGSVHVQAWRERDGHGIAWNALTYWRGGYPPSPQEEAAAHHAAQGAFVLRPDGSTRGVRAAPPASERALPALVAQETDAAWTWDGRYAHYHGRADGRRHVVRPDGTIVVTFAPAAEDQARRIYVTRAGTAVVLGARQHLASQGGARHHVLAAEAFDPRGTRLFRVELRRTVEPPGVP